MPAADRLAIEVSGAGIVTRWGPDEIDAGNIPGDLILADSIPGGYKTLDCSLFRRPTRTYDDLNLFDDVSVYAPGFGNEVVWNGRQEYFPKKQGADFGVDINAVGYQAAMDDVPFQQIIVDTDLAHWGQPSVQRRLNLIANSYGVQDTQLATDETTGQPALQSHITGAWVAAYRPLIEAVYDSLGIPIASLYYAWKSTLGGNDPNWDWRAELSTNDVHSATDTTGDLQAAGPGTGTLAATDVNRIIASMQHSYSAGPAGSDNGDFPLDWTCLAVYGDHGITKRGTASATAAQGFYADDILRYLIDTYFAGLTYTDESIDDAHDFAIPQLAWLTHTKGSAAVALLNGYFWRDWAVWNDGVVHWHEPDSTTYDWEVRKSEGARYEDTGDSAEELYNGVIVQWRDAAGAQHVTTPTDAATLLDTSDTNPCNKAGITRWGVLNFDKVTTSEGAVKAGVAWLTVYSRRRHRGTLSITGWARHRTRGLLPAYMIRSGDWVRIVDDDDQAYRKVVAKTYRRSSRTADLELDNRSYRLEAMFEQLGLAIVDVVGGG